ASYLARFARPVVNDLIGEVLSGLKRRLETRNVESQPLIFFSYRRSQARYVGGRIYDALCSEFGPRSVFRDVDSILGGGEWTSDIDKALNECRVVVAHIGEGWEDALKQRWNDDPPDVLRLELERA